MSKTAKLPSIAKVKKFLYADWALRVKQRDGFKCLLCGATENLTAHHWYVCDHHAHAARYCVDNGATLCYACHIRGVHQRADWKSVSDVASAVIAGGRYEEVMGRIDILVETELSVPALRTMFDARRQIPVVPPEDALSSLELYGKKMFVRTYGNQMAVAGNTLSFGVHGIFEVLVVTKIAEGYRYTVKRLEEGK